MTKYKNFYFKWNTKKTKVRVFIYYLYCQGVAVGSFTCTDVWSNAWRVMFSRYFRKVKKWPFSGVSPDILTLWIVYDYNESRSKKVVLEHDRTGYEYGYVSFFPLFLSVRCIQACGQTMWNILSHTSVHVGTYRLVRKLRTTNVFCVLSPFIRA